MPISADPNETVEYSLKRDLDKPIESRPVFVCRFMTYSEHRKIKKLRDEANSKPNTEEGSEQTYKLLCEVVGIGIVGWKNQTQTYPAEIGDILTDLEIWELVWGYPQATRLAEIDKKKLPQSAPPVSEVSTVATSPTHA